MPSTRKPRRPFRAKWRTACAGFTDARMPGARTMCTTPKTAITTNQTAITGPKTDPTPPVPLFWKRKSPTRMAIVIGTTKYANASVATFSPSTALRTEMAGVMIPSP